MIETVFFNNNPTPGRATRYSLQYDALGNRTTISADNPASPYVTQYEYKDGNCIKKTSQAGTPMELVYEYEFYLDRENKLRSSTQENSVTGNTPNRNLIKRSTLTWKPSPNYRSFTNYAYEFNAEGFPVKMTYTNFNNQDGSLTNTDSTVNEYACP